MKYIACYLLGMASLAAILLFHYFSPLDLDTYDEWKVQPNRGSIEIVLQWKPGLQEKQRYTGNYCSNIDWSIEHGYWQERWIAQYKYKTDMLEMRRKLFKSLDIPCDSNDGSMR